MLCPNCNVKLVEERKDFHKCPQCPFNMMPNETVLNQLYAWVSVDKNGYEGMLAFNMQGVMMSAVSSNLKTMKNMKPLAEASVKPVGLKTKLVEFKRIGIVET